MEKKDFIKRIILWSILFLVTLSCFILGILKYYDGYGKHGSIRIELIPIIDKFNSLDNIKNNKNDIKASYSNDSIEIKYVSNVANLKYVFNYSIEDDIKYITLTYSDINSDIVEEFAKEIIEIVSSMNGNNYGDVFSKYNYSNFYATTMEDGIHLENDSGNVTLTIAINKNTLSLIEDKFLNDKKEDVKYITSIDLKDMVSILKTEKYYVLEKNSIYLYVQDDGTYYNIYISDKDKKENYIYESIMSCIYILDSNIYDYAYKNKESFSTDSTKDIYSIVMNPELPEDITIKNQAFRKVSIKK